MFDRINALVAKHGFAFQSWDDRYSKGVWAALAPIALQLDDVRESSEAGDSDMIPAMEYVLSTEWLPLVTGRDFIDALNILEGRLASIPADQLARYSPWSTAVSNALDHLREVQNAHKGYGAADGHYGELPVTFVDMLAVQPVV